MTTDPACDPDAPVPLTLDHDLNELSEGDLQREVTRLCSAYGCVVKVTVHSFHAHLNARAFTLVDMSSAEEAERLAAAFNRRRMGATVLLLFEPRPTS